MKKIAAFLSFLLLLGGCAQDQPTAETIQEHFDALPGFTAHVKIISDFDESVLEYEVDYAYNRKGSDHLTLTAPESVRGIEATIDGEERILLRYGGAELDDGTPGLQGTTPADGVYWVLRELRESEPLEIWPESVSGTPALAVRYEGTVEDTEITRQVWLRQDSLQPLCAEVYSDGTRVLLLTFSDYQEGMTVQPEADGETDAVPPAEPDGA